jgi:putative restriction endonuclease
MGLFLVLTDTAWGFLGKYLPELAIPEELGVDDFTEIILGLDETSDLPEPKATDPLQRKRTLAQRTLRDRKFSNTIKELYDNRCAVCRKKRLTLEKIPEVEAAHINPVEKDGPDDYRNGIALCRLHHWAFDGGLFSITNDLKIIVHPSIKGKADYEEIYDLEGNEILPPKLLKYAPHPIFLKEHRLLHDFEMVGV